MYKKGLLSIILSFALVLVLCLNKEQSPLPYEKQKEEPKREIKQEIFGYQSYEEIIKTFKSWESSQPEIIDVVEFGKLKNHYLRISDEKSPSDKVIMLTACIHGNEPLSTSVMMSFVSKLLSEQEIFKTRTIYFIPIISLEAYPSSRHVNGLDPNRDFDKNNNVAPVRDIKELFLKIKPDAVLSGHTYGRVFLYPWGHTREKNPRHESYSKMVEQMSKLSGYGNKRICELYGRPIKGTESDWYDSHGAFSIVIEFGTHQRKPTREESKIELDKTYNAILYFIKEIAL